MDKLTGLHTYLKHKSMISLPFNHGTTTNVNYILTKRRAHELICGFMRQYQDNNNNMDVACVIAQYYQAFQIETKTNTTDEEPTVVLELEGIKLSTRNEIPTIFTVKLEHCVYHECSGVGIYFKGFYGFSPPPPTERLKKVTDADGVTAFWGDIDESDQITEYGIRMNYQAVSFIEEDWTTTQKYSTEDIWEPLKFEYNTQLIAKFDPAARTITYERYDNDVRQIIHTTDITVGDSFIVEISMAACICSGGDAEHTKRYSISVTHDTETV